MVVLHVKSTTTSSSSSPEEMEMEFLHECAAAAAVADVAAALAGTAGLQARLLSLCRRLRDRCPDGSAGGGELERALSEAEAYASKEQVRHNKFLSPRALREHIKIIEKIAANALHESSEALCLQQPKLDEKHDKVPLWWAGKELAMDKKLSDYIGVNDKTKIVVILKRPMSL
ncbi:UPF0769 protein C21orf59 homolog [Brachypodium distachyon]|uniref:Uncharacterized protein n=1 Tax=Brachypodium distachyon TaxID=15368 RepID=A0A0Q3KA48_BRADI|nr:UPF0769 protein C21orf59 homolog [Brachypodium distachyon]KQK07777.1 hypothetical protein BRADI_2g37552v3 [Brachypodium distachyon]PNT71931.1 hypothetical protein BRADI_2g37552v3 [Brachypodium distachyon]PNT71932.1 hypothetical protein BRADI_2g37552v3 [Brachypodium distachyon]PNT71933.1 hypothetical protein BRADI_2g37552v3 [Brachypodium distachyon]PNT71934.1 hypothetical protein BRADI_2g37552v3 [Brachypodium distachyon]|eukprot:XP_010231776.1 UPF0769 protein C21orf59 homolog [Brachypodium distachyon]